MVPLTAGGQCGRGLRRIASSKKLEATFFMYLENHIPWPAPNTSTSPTPATVAARACWCRPQLAERACGQRRAYARLGLQWRRSAKQCEGGRHSDGEIRLAGPLCRLDRIFRTRPILLRIPINSGVCFRQPPGVLKRMRMPATQLLHLMLRIQQYHQLRCVLPAAAGRVEAVLN